MTRLPRYDDSGEHHHVMSRGTAKRPIFETRQDVRFLLSLIARMVKDGKIAVLAYCVLTTHYHLLLRSVTGELSSVMQWIQVLYSKYFNRTRDRDGPTYRSRFTSKRITSYRYQAAVLWYIDRNAVEAGLVTRPEDYPYGSAQHYAHHHGPSWLARSEVEGVVRTLAGADRYRPQDYASSLSGRSNPALYELMQAASKHPRLSPDRALDNLFGAAAPATRDWLIENARNADGGPAGTLVASARSLCVSLQARRDAALGPSPMPAGSDWDILEAGLLRSACGLTLRQVAMHQEVSSTSIYRRLKKHAERMEAHSEYCAVAAEILREALNQDFGFLGALPQERPA